MASPKQIAANRANARKSTGPRTARGKFWSRLNARKHGVFATGLALTPDELAALEGWRSRWIAALSPQTSEQLEVLESLARAAWSCRQASQEHLLLAGSQSPLAHEVAFCRTLKTQREFLRWNALAHTVFWNQPNSESAWNRQPNSLENAPAVNPAPPGKIISWNEANFSFAFNTRAAAPNH